MQIDGKTKVCALLGKPVAHTRSPLIHNELAAKLGINLVYEAFEVEEDNLEVAVKGAHALGILGMNVTVPHKEAVISALCEIDALAEKIGAVNTLVYQENGYKGYNTDMPGLYRAMVSDGVVVDNREVILLGAGGVARAVAMLLADKVSRLYILNRTLDKAIKIADEVNAHAGRDVVVAMELSTYRDLQVWLNAGDKESAGHDKKYIVIQATNVGMHPECDRTLIEDEAFYQMVEVGYDLIYNPAETLFMKEVKQAGGRAYNGLKMLLYQGIIAFELWNEVQVEDELAEEVYEKMKESM